MEKSKPSGRFSRIIITLIGVAFIVWALTLVVLRFAGERETAVIDTVRRELGRRSEANPNRYIYNISYTFTLPNGKAINGFSRRVGGAGYFKASGVSTAPVRYFSFFPYVNALEEDAEPGYKQLIMIIAGGVLIYFTNREKKRRNRRVRKTTA
ncbi:MAG: hypothetical protein AB2L20_22185 [Mangrovibacterium sp.]